MRVREYVSECERVREREIERESEKVREDRELSARERE